jgi:hypothetical protein
MIIFLIYFIGVVATWWLYKWLRNMAESNEWKDAILAFIISMLSWTGFAVIIIMFIIHVIEHYKSNNKPPKWL